MTSVYYCVCIKLQYAVCHSPFLSVFCYQAPFQIQYLWFVEEQFVKLVLSKDYFFSLWFTGNPHWGVELNAHSEYLFLNAVCSVEGPTWCCATEVWRGRALHSHSGASGGVWDQSWLPVFNRGGLHWGVIWLPACSGPLRKYDTWTW